MSTLYLADDGTHITESHSSF